MTNYRTMNYVVTVEGLHRHVNCLMCEGSGRLTGGNYRVVCFECKGSGRFYPIEGELWGYLNALKVARSKGLSIREERDPKEPTSIFERAKRPDNVLIIRREGNVGAFWLRSEVKAHRRDRWNEEHPDGPVSMPKGHWRRQRRGKGRGEVR